jgi:hypothetical protein
MLATGPVAAAPFGTLWFTVNNPSDVPYESLRVPARTLKSV